MERFVVRQKRPRQEEEDVDARCPVVQRDVFGVSGLTLVEDFLSKEEERRLLECVAVIPVWNGKYARRTHNVGGRSGEPLPQWCDFLLDRLESELNLRRPDQMLINEYLPGQSIAPHVDKPDYGDGVVSISLAADVCMDFASIAVAKDQEQYQVEGLPPPDVTRHELLLPRRSALVLTKDARYKWTHGIAPKKFDHGKPRKTRISLTFRKAT